MPIPHELTAKQRALLEDVRNCPGESMQDHPSQVIGWAFHQGFIISDGKASGNEPLKYGYWWLTERGESVLRMEPTDAPE